MKILEYGNPKNDKIILIHGFESPYQIWEDYIDYYKKYYCIIVPILPGHNINEKEDFISLKETVEKLETYYISKYGNKVFAIYGMSMGGLIASNIWERHNIQIDKLILESSPIFGYGKIITKALTSQYLTITHKAQKRDKRVIKQAVNSIITKDKLNIFLELIDYISDVTIINYIKEIGMFKLIDNIDTPNTKVYYLYGGKLSEILFKNNAKKLRKNYKNIITMCLKGKGHCEDALLNPKKHIRTLNNILKK